MQVSQMNSALQTPHWSQNPPVQLMPLTASVSKVASQTKMTAPALAIMHTFHAECREKGNEETKNMYQNMHWNMYKEYAFLLNKGIRNLHIQLYHMAWLFTPGAQSYGHLLLKGKLRNADDLVKKLGVPLLFVLSNMLRTPEDINTRTDITNVFKATLS